MVLVDVNVLIYAHRGESDHHPLYQAWLQNMVNGDQAYGMADLALSAFLRIVTNARLFARPSTQDEAFAFIDAVREHPNCVRVEPGARHWEIFTRLCKAVNARGNLVTDAYFAALAIESGSQLITADHDFSRFPGLDWRHPLA